jgi:hypothetical protein
MESWIPGSLFCSGEMSFWAWETILCLSTSLIDKLNNHRILYLYQARHVPSRGDFFTDWVGGVNLELEEDEAVEWEKFRKNLIDSGINLQDRPDTLLWTGGDKTGQLTTKNVYEAVATKIWTTKVERMAQKDLEMGLPHKNKDFYLVVGGKQDSHMGESSKTRMGGT